MLDCVPRIRSLTQDEKTDVFDSNVATLIIFVDGEGDDGEGWGER